MANLWKRSKFFGNFNYGMRRLSGEGRGHDAAFSFAAATFVAYVLCWTNDDDVKIVKFTI